MAYEILNNAYLCRTLRSTKLYARPNDIKPSNVIIPEDITLTTDEECQINGIKFFKISSIVKGEDDQYIGMWISSQEIEYSKILLEEKEPQEIQPDDSEDVEVWLVTNVPKVTFYEKSTSGTGLPMELPVGSAIAADKKVNVTINGFTQTRYHVADCIDPEGMPLFLVIDMWVRYGTEVRIKDDTDIVPVPDVPTLQSANRDRAEARGTYNKNKNKEPKNERERQRQARLAAQKKAKETMAKNEQKAMESNFTSAAVKSVVAAVPRQTQNRNNNATTPSAVYENQTIFNDVDVDYGDVNNIVAGYTQGYFSNGQSIMGTPIGRMLFVHGMPFQFTHYTDRRTGSTKQYGNANEYYDLTRMGTSIKSGGSKAAGADFYGRSYEQEIACNIPIMSVVPGEPQYMSLVTGSFVFPTYTKAKRQGQDFSALFNVLTDKETQSVINDINLGASDSNLYQYYTMSVNTDEYFAYVNTLCKMSAILMGLSDFQYYGTKCTLVDWGNYNSTNSGGQDYNMLEEIIGIDGGVSFAYDPGSSVTDSLSNTIEDSQFTGLLKGISQKAREAGFLFGNWANDIDYLSAVDDTDYDSSITGITSSTLGKVFGGQGILGRASTFIKNSGKGMNIRFPKVWQDSSSSKDYSIEMHFIAPYATNFCKWRYVLVPFFHCFALTAPRMKTSLNMYSTPFLIRAYSKGYFNVEMGMINSLSWRRFGDGGDMVSDDGIPTQIDVTMDFQDMYQTIGMSKIDGAWDPLNITGKGITAQLGLFFNNTGLMDMLGTMSGVNMNRMNIGERIALYWNAAATIGVAGLPGNFKRAITDRIRNLYESWITKGM